MAVDYSATPKKKGGFTFLIVFFSVFILACVGLLVIKSQFTITVVEVTGNEHYTSDEIEDLVLSGKYGHNSIFLYLKCKANQLPEIPFVQDMDVEIISPRAVKIQIYEKAMAGYVEYLDHYMYFDKDGIIVESSTQQVEGVPFVTGLDFNYIALHEKLPVENEDIFRLILNITQLLTKYEISTDRIYFDKDYNITLYFDAVRIYLGTNDYIDEKINRLRFILPELSGHSGVLHMENYIGEGDKFTFSRD